MLITRILTHRFVICFINAVILTITLAIIYQTTILLANQTNDFNKIEDILDGIGIIFVAYGVALEERDTLMKFFNLYPKYENARENRTDLSCHFYGLCLLLLGLFMEVSAEVVRVPNMILNTEGIEGLIFGIGLLFCSLTIVTLLRFSYVLLRLKRSVVK
jgi:hypothetical protein